MRLAGHIRRHQELVASRLSLWEPIHGVRSRRKPAMTYVDSNYGLTPAWAILEKLVDLRRIECYGDSAPILGRWSNLNFKSSKWVSAPQSSTRPFQRGVYQFSISIRLDNYSIAKWRLKRRVVVLVVVAVVVELHLHCVYKGWQLFSSLFLVADFDEESFGEGLQAQKILLFWLFTKNDCPLMLNN